MKDITLRFVLRQNFDKRWRLLVADDFYGPDFAEHVCDIAGEDPSDVVIELAELLGGALQKMAMERAERNQE